jgi:hypothetical protein
MKIRSTTSFGGEVKPLVPCRNILWHVKEHTNLTERIQRPYLTKLKWSEIRWGYTIHKKMVALQGSPCAPNQHTHAHAQLNKARKDRILVTGSCRQHMMVILTQNLHFSLVQYYPGDGHVCYTKTFVTLTRLYGITTHKLTTQIFMTVKGPNLMSKPHYSLLLASLC